jgi:hypothetical protein
LHQAALGEAFLEEFPSLRALFLGGALGLRLIRAKKNVAADLAYVQTSRDFGEAIGIGLWHAKYSVWHAGSDSLVGLAVLFRQSGEIPRLWCLSVTYQCWLKVIAYPAD